MWFTDNLSLNLFNTIVFISLVVKMSDSQLATQVPSGSFTKLQADSYVFDLQIVELKSFGGKLGITKGFLFTTATIL